MITLWRIILAGSRNFMRNAWLSTAATAVMTITLVISLFSFASNSALTATIRGIVNKIDVSIYFDDATSVEQIKNVQQRLQGIENVESVQYISKVDALEEFKEQNKNDPTLLSGLSEGDNPLPASLRIKTKDQQRIQEVINVLDGGDIKPLLDKKTPYTYTGEKKATIDRIVNVSNFLKTSGLVATFIFLTISILVIFNTIRMAIFTRRSEIEIMKLVGATNWFIRGPFIFEAILYGVIAAVVALAICYSLLPFAPALAGFIPDIQNTIDFFHNYPLVVIALELLLGIVIGAFSSLLAMTRYLKL